MNNIHVSIISESDSRARRQVDALLAKEGITRDARLEETLGIFDDSYQLVATGSLFANTLRCIAVDHAYQGEGLTGTLITALLERQTARGHHHVFLYTKLESAPYFRDLGFHEIARVENRLVFMENRRNAFQKYLDELSNFQEVPGKKTAAIVMNANPFTLGHQYLLERAAAENDAVRCFVVSEDVSLVPFAARLHLVKAGSAHLSNVTVHPSGSYMVSNATFPSYFLKDEQLVTETQAMLDIEVFTKIAKAMGITARYIGEEPFSTITQVYNEVMRAQLPQHGIECVLLPRRAEDGAAISASGVRQLIKEGRIDDIQPLVPAATYAYFLSPAGQETVRAIEAAQEVRHA